MAFFDKKKLDRLKSEAKDKTKYRIMLVDDEEENLRALTALLSDTYEIISAADGQEALECIHSMEHPEKICLVLSDQLMPRLTGTQLFDRLVSIIPNTIRIILTGYMESIEGMSNNNANFHKIIRKPYQAQDLLLEVERAVVSFNTGKPYDG